MAKTKDETAGSISVYIVIEPLMWDRRYEIGEEIELSTTDLKKFEGKNLIEIKPIKKIKEIADENTASGADGIN